MAAPRRGEVPLYQQVRSVLLDRIVSGQYAPGDRLPSEAVLAEDLGVHRLTVRRALDELSREGLLRARQGAVAGDRRAAPRPGPPAAALRLADLRRRGGLDRGRGGPR